MIFSYIYKSMMYRQLLSDAELTKNISQYLIRRYLAGDFAEMEHAFADVLGKEIVGNADLQPFFYTENSFKGFVERFIMTQVGYDHIFLANSRNSGGFD